MKALSNFIQSQVKFPEEELEIIVSHFQQHIIDKEKFLIKKGQVVSCYYFVVSGGLRIYFDRDDRQITGWLAFENDFFTELTSMKSGQPTLFNIQALEDTVLLFIEKPAMELLYSQYPLWQQFGRLVWEAAFLKVINGILSYQTMSAEERYLTMMTQSDILQRVPLKQLASYLGITQTSLSRLRKSIR